MNITTKCKQQPLSWYVVQTNSRAESKVANRLENKHIQTYLPTFSTFRIWSDRKKKVTLPLIPSVVFIHCNSEQLQTVYSIDSVYSVLKFNGKPAIVRNHEIEQLRILEKEMDGELIEPCELEFSPGDEVYVHRGPFKGLYGKSIETEGKHRIVITLDSIGAAFTVRLPKSVVRKVINNDAA